MANNVLVLHVLVPSSLVCLVVVLIIAWRCCEKYRQTGSEKQPDRGVLKSYSRPTQRVKVPRGPAKLRRSTTLVESNFEVVGGNDAIISPCRIPRFQTYSVADTWREPANVDAQSVGNEKEMDMISVASYSTRGGPANDDTQFVENVQLMDSDLHDLMVPDMNESVVREVRSKPIMFISRRIDQMGGTLVLDNMGIFLTVPPGAIEPGKPEIIFLALNWDLRDLPRMTPNQTIVSPVVQVGPHGLKLKRQATLSFRHCAFDSNQVKVNSSESHLMQDKEWSAIEGDEEGETSSHRVLDKECQVYLSHFTLFTCIAEGEAVKKWLQIVAFGKMIGSQYEIRIYLLNGTPCALQFAVENEKKFHFRQMKGPQEYLFCDDMTNMIIRVESISEGWSSNVEEMQEEIPFLSIWHGKSPFTSFVFKMLNRETNEINTTISARQGGGYKLRLKLLKEIRQKQREGTNSRNKSVENGDHVSMSSPMSGGFAQGLVSEYYVPRSHAALQMASSVLPENETSLAPLSSGVCCPLTSSQNSTPIIPHKLKMKLVELMDPLKAAGNDWRMIASELGVDSKIDFLGMQNSPFLEVLGIMQGRKKDLGWLKETLILHERKDAADVITLYLETTGID